MKTVETQQTHLLVEHTPPKAIKLVEESLIVFFLTDIDLHNHADDEEQTINAHLNIKISPPQIYRNVHLTVLEDRTPPPPPLPIQTPMVVDSFLFL